MYVCMYVYCPTIYVIQVLGPAESDSGLVFSSFVVWHWLMHRVPNVVNQLSLQRCCQWDAVTANIAQFPALSSYSTEQMPLWLYIC